MTLANKKTWAGLAPTHCELSGDPIEDRFYDANLTGIGWGCYSEKTFVKWGGLLGYGRGQQYTQCRLSKQWVKTS
jgi:hypothetical protein